MAQIKDMKVFNFIHSKLFKSAEISRVGQITANKKLLKHGLKVGVLPSKKTVLFAQLKSFKRDEKCFFFHLKKSFYSQDI